MGRRWSTRSQVKAIQDAGVVKVQSRVGSPNWFGGVCNVRVRTRKRVVSSETARSRSSVESAPGTNRQAPARGRGQSRAANECSLAGENVDGVELRPADRSHAIQIAGRVKRQVGHSGGVARITGVERTDHRDQPVYGVDRDEFSCREGIEVASRAV